jgi:uncharacterized protein YbjQ (UPF0145 family)
LSKNIQKVTSLSGNEIFCLNKLDMSPGQLCIGNSVVSIGVGGGIGAGLSTLGGGEVSEVTNLVHDGRKRAFDRMMVEAESHGGTGLTGVSFEMVNHGGNLEFITTGSTVRSGTSVRGAREPVSEPISRLAARAGIISSQSPGNTLNMFSTSADAQELYCQLDAGFTPSQFVFGNIAYSIGMGGNITGAFRALRRGEVPQYTEIFDKTRHMALKRITDEAKRCNANSVIGIKTTIAPLMGTQEMMMVGTASNHPLASQISGDVLTSDMTNEEMWNMVNLGYMPVQLVMGVSVYSLGFTSGIMSVLQSLRGGEVRGLTEILYEAREKALERIERDATACGADEVVGVKTYVYDLGENKNRKSSAAGDHSRPRYLRRLIFGIKNRQWQQGLGGIDSTRSARDDLYHTHRDILLY